MVLSVLMRHRFGRKIVVALGGSVIYPEQIDSRFIRDFKRFVERQVRRGTKLLIVVGGGRVARLYQEAASGVGVLADEDKDWLGIHATRMNAHLIRTIFRKIANPVIIDARGKMDKLDYPVTVAGGWRPGWSTDFVAMALAEDFNVPEIVVAGKPDYVYDKDPRRYKNAKPIPNLSWKEYCKLIPGKWTPGFHSPVDPVAARLGFTAGIKAIIVNGKDLKNIEAMLAGKGFKGTMIN